MRKKPTKWGQIITHQMPFFFFWVKKMPLKNGRENEKGCATEVPIKGKQKPPA